MLKQILALFVACVPIALTAKPLIVGDSTYPEACKKQEWEIIKAKLTSFANGRSEERLTKLAHTYICGRGAVAANELLRNAPKEIQVVSAGSGQAPTTELIDAQSALQPQAGSAWGVEVSESENQLRISFWKDEACIATTSLVFRANSWLITRMEESCD